MRKSNSTTTLLSRIVSILLVWLVTGIPCLFAVHFRDPGYLNLSVCLFIYSYFGNYCYTQRYVSKHGHSVKFACVYILIYPAYWALYRLICILKHPFSKKSKSK